MAFQKKSKNTPFILLGALALVAGIGYTFFTVKGKAWFATMKAKFIK